MPAKRLASRGSRRSTPGRSKLEVMIVEKPVSIRLSTIRRTIPAPTGCPRLLPKIVYHQRAIAAEPAQNERFARSIPAEGLLDFAENVGDIPNAAESV